MATVRFTQNIQRHVSCPTIEVEGDQVWIVLEAYFQPKPPMYDRMCLMNAGRFGHT
jgi:hypothetical protein